MNAAFEHVGGVAVTQDVRADFLVFFAEAAFGGGHFDGGPDARFGHVMTAVVEGLAKADAGAFPTPSGSGEEPGGITMGLPEGAEAGEEFRGDGDFAGFATFAMTDAQDETLAVDVFRFDLEGFTHAKAALIEEGEVGAVASIAKGAQKKGNFFPGQNVGKHFFPFDFDLWPDLPTSVEVISVEGAQGADGLVDGAAFQLPVVLKMDEKVEDLGTFQGGEFSFGEVTSELVDPPEIGFD